MARHPPVAVDGYVRVCAEMCPTCIFRPGNVMHLQPGRVRQMVDQAKNSESAIICHHSLDKRLGAVCRGFYDRYPTQPLQIAQRLGRVKEVDPDHDE